MVVVVVVWGEEEGDAGQKENAADEGPHGIYCFDDAALTNKGQLFYCTLSLSLSLQVILQSKARCHDTIGDEWRKIS